MILRLIVLSLVFFAAGAGCAVGPVNGLVFSSTSFPGEINPANDVSPKKSGQGCERMFLGLIAFGNAGAGDIANENGIKRIASVDHSTTNFLQIVYSSYCTIVQGE